MKNDDGTPNMAASWDKVEDHRANLERRMGAGEAPPKEAKDYATNVPEALKEAIKTDELAASPKFQEFRDAMHAAGLSQKQFDQVVGKMLDYSIALQAGSAALNEQQAVAALREGWKTDAEFQQHTRAAFQAAQTFAAPVLGDMTKVMAKFGNDPDFIRVMAAVGAELGEDTSARPSGSISEQAEIEALAKSPAYFNPNDPQHAAVKARVTAFYEKQFGTAPKQSGSLSIGTV